jgi:hypothetical protein
MRGEDLILRRALARVSKDETAALEKDWLLLAGHAVCLQSL